jgi:hypothetical protein
MDAGSVDHRVRLAAFSFLDQQTRINGEVLAHAVLHEGFVFEGPTFFRGRLVRHKKGRALCRQARQ